METKTDIFKLFDLNLDKWFFEGFEYPHDMAFVFRYGTRYIYVPDCVVFVNSK